jgi:hypothetical protein
MAAYGPNEIATGLMDDPWQIAPEPLPPVPESAAEVDAARKGDLLDDLQDMSLGAKSAGGTVEDASLEDVDGFKEKALDYGESAFNAVSPLIPEVLEDTSKVAKDAAKAGEKLPGIGEIISGTQAFYHAGAAGYDALTGDRDGAVAHGAQAVANGVATLPGAGEAMGAIDTALGSGGFIAKTMGVDGVPQSCADLAADVAVTETNAVFGTSGQNPTGNRRGEIGAGVSMMEGALLGPIGPIVGIQNAFLNERAGNPVGNYVGDLFGTKEDAPTSGAGEPSVEQRAGLSAHEKAASLFDGLY